MRILEIFGISRFFELAAFEFKFDRVIYAFFRAWITFIHSAIMNWAFDFCYANGQGRALLFKRFLFGWIVQLFALNERENETEIQKKKWLNAMHCQRTQWIQIENDFKWIYFNQMSIEMLGSLLAPAFCLIFSFNI